MTSTQTLAQLEAHLALLIRNHEAGVRGGHATAGWVAATEAEIVATIAKLDDAR